MGGGGGAEKSMTMSCDGGIAVNNLNLLLCHYYVLASSLIPCELETFSSGSIH